MARARLLLLVPLLCVLTSCGAGETGPAPERPDDWGFRPRRYCPVNLPEATHARWDRDAQEHPLVCLTAGGDVSFERGHWSLATARDAERQNELALFEATLGHHGHAAPRPTLQFQFDADARWTYVAALLRIAARVPGLDDRVLWNVASSATWRPVHQAVRILPLSEGSRDLPTVEIRARPPLDGARWRVEMELTAGGESVITIEEDYESEERAATRAAWDAAAARWGTVDRSSRGACGS